MTTTTLHEQQEADILAVCCGDPFRCYHYHGPFGDQHCGDPSCDRAAS